MSEEVKKTCVSFEDLPYGDPIEKFELKELISALCCYLLGWIYINGMAYDSGWSVVIALAIVGLTLLLNWKKDFTLDKGIWMAVLLIFSVSYGFLDGGIFEQQNVFFVMHLCAVYFVCVVSQTRLEEKTTAWVILDGLRQLIIVPFSHLFLRIRTVIGYIRQHRQNRTRISGWNIVAGFVAFFLLFLAFEYLSGINQQFMEVITDFFEELELGWELIKLLLSLPVGAYLCGLINGSYRTEEETIQAYRQNTLHFFDEIKAVGPALWIVVILLFTVLYCGFFAFDAPYLFSAFRRVTYNGMTVAEYARQGFFELCKVMAVNFIVVLLANHTLRKDSSDQAVSAVRIMSLLLLGESLVFAAIALSKLLLYIRTFGYTVLRLQSLWLIIVLILAVLAWAVNLLSGKKTFTLWFYFSLISFAALSCIRL